MNINGKGGEEIPQREISSFFTVMTIDIAECIWYIAKKSEAHFTFGGDKE